MAWRATTISIAVRSVSIAGDRRGSTASGVVCVPSSGRRVDLLDLPVGGDDAEHRTQRQVLASDGDAVARIDWRSGLEQVAQVRAWFFARTDISGCPLKAQQVAQAIFCDGLDQGLCWDGSFGGGSGCDAADDFGLARPRR